MPRKPNVEWEHPRLFDITRFASVAADCKDGSTASTPGSPTAGCGNGGIVSEGDNLCFYGNQTASGSGKGHPCQGGGSALTCNAGSVP